MLLRWLNSQKISVQPPSLANIKHYAETLAFVAGKHFNAGAAKEWGPALALECEKWNMNNILYGFGELPQENYSY